MVFTYRHLMDVIQARHNVSLQTLWKQIELYPSIWLVCFHMAQQDVVLAADIFVIELDI